MRVYSAPASERHVNGLSGAEVPHRGAPDLSKGDVLEALDRAWKVRADAPAKLHLSGQEPRPGGCQNARVADARPAPEEFEEARRRELARLNLRISSMMGRTIHTPEDSEILEGDSAERRWADMAAVRRRSENPPGHGGA